MHELYLIAFAGGWLIFFFKRTHIAITHYLLILLQSLVVVSLRGLDGLTFP